MIITMIPLARNIRQPSRVQIGCVETIDSRCLMSRVHLKDGVLDDLDSIDDVSNKENEGDDHEGHKGGVAQVFDVDVLVLVVELQVGGGKVEIVPVVTVPGHDNHLHQKCGM